MVKTEKSKKQKATKKPETNQEIATTDPKIKKKILKKKPKSKKPKSTLDPLSTTQFNGKNPDTSSESDYDPSEIRELLEPYTKEQLIEFVSSAATDNRPLRSLIRAHADRDISHRKIFVRGLPWNASNETLLSEFRGFGEIEDCNVVTDKATGRAKGYGFIVFKKRKGAANALKNPSKMVGNRVWSWQLASVGPINSVAGQVTPSVSVVAPGGEADQDVGPRKIYVGNVAKNTDKERLRDFFSRFGEIEVGPLGFDMLTGKCKGYAMFVYKTVEGARKVLEEPHKVFEGHKLHCSVAKEGKSNAGASNQLAEPEKSVTQQPLHLLQQAPHEQMLAAVAAAQNLALFGRHPGLNPVYSGFLGNSVAGGGGIGGMISPAGGMSAVMQGSQFGGLGIGNQALLGNYRLGQGEESVYTGTGQAGMNKGQLDGSSFPCYPSYM